LCVNTTSFHKSRVTRLKQWGGLPNNESKTNKAEPTNNNLVGNVIFFNPKGIENFPNLSTLDKAKGLSTQSGLKAKSVLSKGVALCRVFNPVKSNNPFAGAEI
jgi:hypothetical protein